MERDSHTCFICCIEWLLLHVVFVEMKSTFSSFCKARKNSNNNNKSRNYLRSRTPLNVCTRGMQQQQHVCLNVWRWIEVAGPRTTISILTLLQLVDYLSIETQPYGTSVDALFSNSTFCFNQISVRRERRFFALSSSPIFNSFAECPFTSDAIIIILDERKYWNRPLNQNSRCSGRDLRLSKIAKKKINTEFDFVWMRRKTCCANENVNSKQNGIVRYGCELWYTVVQSHTGAHIHKTQSLSVYKESRNRTSSAASTAAAGSRSWANRKFICSFVVFFPRFFFFLFIFTKFIIKYEFCGWIFSIRIFNYLLPEGLHTIFNTQTE